VNTFVVDFEVGAAQEVFACGCSTDVSEDVFHRAGDYTGLVLISGLHIMVKY